MAVINRTAASLRFLGDDLDPADITARLGMAPTASERKGDAIASPQGRQRFAPTGRWMRRAAERRPGDLDAQVRDLLDGLSGDPSVWRELARFRPELFVGLFLGQWNEGIELGSETLRSLSERGIGIGLDVYSGGERTEIVLRRAAPADVPLLRYWDTKPHVIAATGNEGDDGGWDWESEVARLVPWKEILIAELGRRPLGVLQIIDPSEEATHYWGAVEPDLRALDIWIGEEADLGRGHGTEMLRLALERCFAAPHVTAVLIDPLAGNTRARRFYERQGFRFVGERTFGGDNCAVYRLERQDWRA